ncbi:sugar phosphate isomerase/epimerase family protein [Sphingomonas jatrophae]|uniref:Xylose isomerase-like TIM barrel n=1 Tax=Sphingomonas jatrophae TaxID=1166337 RepID=A0A1I6KJ38_9SPHN|nr:TIM barrel protein [Sphingomonas jatrophae]SFR91253.1 Xylose isomerase-like TIM barrel [Sphingomonas jatrophae]
MRLALDHLTVADTTPSQLVAVAAAAGCAAVCLFLEPMAVLPRLPGFDIHGDTAERRETLARMADSGVTLDIAYPFTLSARSDIAAFAPALETAARLGAWGVNVLAYDRDAARRADRFAAFCEAADGFGLKVVVEYYPLSQVRTLREAVALVRGVGAPGRVGVNADLLHLARSGGTVADLAGVPGEWILYGQYCDAPAVQETLSWDYEASHERQLAGEGALDVAGFAAALPPGCRASVELPRDTALAAGVPAEVRARAAVESVRQAIKGRAR